MDNVYKFADYTKESTLVVGADGQVVKQVISYYKDVYPEKYELTEGGAKFSWVIKDDETKVAVLSGLVDEALVEQVVALFRAQKGGVDELAS